MAVDPERIVRITRKLEIVWLNVPDMSLMRMLRDMYGDQHPVGTTDAQVEAKLDEILATVQ